MKCYSPSMQCRYLGLKNNDQVLIKFYYSQTLMSEMLIANCSLFKYPCNIKMLYLSFPLFPSKNEHNAMVGEVQ